MLGVTLESSSKDQKLLRTSEEESVEGWKAVEEESLRGFEKAWEEKEALFLVSKSENA